MLSGHKTNKLTLKGRFDTYMKCKLVKYTMTIKISTFTNI